MEHPGEESPDDIADVEEEEEIVVEYEEVEVEGDELPETARKADPPEGDPDAL